jgi:uncharacterized membrane protein (DUF485 family)
LTTVEYLIGVQTIAIIILVIGTLTALISTKIYVTKRKNKLDKYYREQHSKTTLPKSFDDKTSKESQK